MEVLNSRIDSFKKGKRIKNTALKWPHPHSFRANPVTLSEAGFYYAPSLEDKDNVRCFMCDKELGDWEEEDDPFELHWTKCKDKCAWAVVRCGLKYDYDDDQNFNFTKSREPRSKPMERARLQTFVAQDWWPHDSSSSHAISSAKMAQAGFIYTPKKPSDDTATCLYCALVLGDWTKSDDPLGEHERRDRESNTSCPFFAGSPRVPPAAKTAIARKPSQRVVSKSKSRSTLAANQSDEEDEPVSSKSNALKRSTRKTESTKGKAKAPAIDDVEEGDGEEEEPAPPKKHTRSKSKPALKLSEKPPPTKTTHTRSKSKSIKTPIAADIESESEIAPRKHTRSKSKSVKTPPSVEGSESEAMPKTKKRLTRTKSKATMSVTEESEVEAQLPKKPTRSTRKTASKSKATPKDTSEEEESEGREDYEEDLAAETPKPKKTVRASKAMTRTRSTVAESDGDGDTASVPPRKQTKKPTKPAAKQSKVKGKKPVVQSEEEEEEEETFATPEAVAQQSDSDVFNTPPEGVKSKSQSIDPLEVASVPKKGKPTRSTSSSKSQKKKKEEVEPETDDLDMDIDDEVKEVEVEHPPSPTPPPLPIKVSRTQSKSRVVSETKKISKAPEILQEDEKPSTKKISRSQSKMSVAGNSDVPITPTPTDIETDMPLSSRVSPPPSQISDLTTDNHISSSRPPTEPPQPPSIPGSSSELQEQKEEVKEEAKEKVKETKAKEKKVKKAPAKTVKRSVSLKPLALSQPKGKVIDLSTDEEDTPTTKAKPTSKSQKPASSTSSAAKERPPSTKPAPVLSQTEDMARVEEDVEMADVQSQLQQPPQTPTHQSIRLPAFPGGASTSTRPPPPSQPEEPWKVPLTEEELDLTVEEWLKRQYAAQLEAYRLEGEKQQMEFAERAREVRRRIEGLSVA